LIVIGRPSRSLDGVLPLVAAVAPNVIACNPAAATLTLRRKAGFITFYLDRVMITQVVDSDEGLDLLDAVRDLLNQHWAHRDTIQPRRAFVARHVHWTCGRFCHRPTVSSAARPPAWLSPLPRS
jgi:ArsR family metal-binding transcriptional regulator